MKTTTKLMMWHSHGVTLAEFAGHLVAGTLLFCMIGLAGLALELFVEWLASMGMSAGAVKVLGMATHALLYLDIILMGLWVAASSLKAGKELLQLK